METEPAVLQSLLGCTSVLVKSFHWKAGHCPEAGSGPEHSNNNAHTHPKNHVVEVLVFCMIMVVIEFCVLCIWEDYSFTALFFHGRPARRSPVSPSVRVDFTCKNTRSVRHLYDLSCTKCNRCCAFCLFAGRILEKSPNFSSIVPN